MGPDDYSLLAYDRGGISYFLRFPERPIEFFWLDFQKYIIGDNSFIGLILLIISTFLLNILVFFFLFLLFKDLEKSFLISIIYSVFFSKLDIFHTPINIHIITVSSIYITSLIFFQLFLIKNRNIYIIISLFFYIFGIFWYEIGFFLPIFILIIYYFEKTNKNFKIFIPFFAILLFYSFYRITSAFGFGYTGQLPGHEINLSSIHYSIIELFKIYVGRYFIRSIIYGLYQFNNINIFWKFIFLFLNTFCIIFIYNMIKNIKSINLNKNLLKYSFLLFIIFSIPTLLSGSTGERHTIISSIGFVIILYYLLYFFGKKWKYIFLPLMFLSFIVCQGNSWSQVVASRINGEVYNTLKNNKEILSQSKIVVIDTKSFANNIKHSLINDKTNVLNTYFGAQVFEDWGLEAMVALANEKNPKLPQVYIASGGIENIDTKNIKIFINSARKDENNSQNTLMIPKENIFILDYNFVYKNGFNYGKKIL